MGPSNEYAFRSAELTGHGRQQASPLILWGRRALARRICCGRSSANIGGIIRGRRPCILSAEQFTTGFLEAVRGSGLPSFRQKCRGAKLLAIDDLQFFPGKRRTIEELLHTFDTMVAEGRQLVLASDRALGRIACTWAGTGVASCRAG